MLARSWGGFQRVRRDQLREVKMHPVKLEQNLTL